MSDGRLNQRRVVVHSLHHGVYRQLHHAVHQQLHHAVYQIVDMEKLHRLYPICREFFVTSTRRFRAWCGMQTSALALRATDLDDICTSDIVRAIVSHQGVMRFDDAS